MELALAFVTTKRFNEQVKRNSRRFPADFAFRLSREELEQLVRQLARSEQSGNRSQIATGPQKHRDPRFLPYAFTEHGALMAANVLNSPQAVEMSVVVVRAFVRMRHMLSAHKELTGKLSELEHKIVIYTVIYMGSGITIDSAEKPVNIICHRRKQTLRIAK